MDIASARASPQATYRPPWRARVRSSKSTSWARCAVPPSGSSRTTTHRDCACAAESQRPGLHGTTWVPRRPSCQLRVLYHQNQWYHALWALCCDVCFLLFSAAVLFARVVELNGSAVPVRPALAVRVSPAEWLASTCCW